MLLARLKGVFSAPSLILEYPNQVAGQAYVPRMGLTTHLLILAEASCGLTKSFSKSDSMMSCTGHVFVSTILMLFCCSDTFDTFKPSLQSDTAEQSKRLSSTR